MAGRPGKFQPRFTDGMLDAFMQANTDLGAYEKGAKRIVNAEVLPQGGFAARPGLLKVDRLRGALNALTLSGGPSMPIGPVAVGMGAVVATYNLPPGALLACVDLYNFGGALATSPAPTVNQPNPPESPLVAGSIFVQYYTSAWFTLDQGFAFTDTLRTRRFALPAGQSVVASQIRVLVNCSTSGGAYAWIASVRAFSDAGGPVAAKLWPNAYSSALAYDWLVTPGNIEVYGLSGRLASIPTLMTGSQVTTFKMIQQQAKAFLTHQGFAPQLVTRQGSDVEWNIQNAVFTGIPNYDFGDVVYTNFTPSIWLLTFVNFDTQLGGSTPPLPSGGAHVTISVNGVATSSLQMAPNSSANWVANAAAIQTALLGLPGVSPGLTVQLSSWAQNSAELFVTFGGSGNQGNGFAVSGTCLDKGDAAITAGQVQLGVAGGEPIMSSSRGWPGACALVEQRLALGGFPQVPLALLFSETGDPFVLNTMLTAATAPMLTQIDGKGNETVLSIHLGRTLNVFTSLGEYWFQPGALSATQPPTVVYSTSNGIAPTVDPIETEGLTVFTHASQGVVLEYYYEYQFQNYTAKPISTKASSLVQGIIDNALLRATQSSDTNVHWLVLSNGQAVARATMREQEINAFSLAVTDGLFQSVDVNARAEVNFVVQRQVNGAPVQFLEKLTPGLWLDGAETFGVTGGQATISGLSDFVGATVWAIVDGYTQGPFSVGSAASIGLEFPVAANGTATVGRWTAPLVETLPLPRDVGPRTVVRRPARAHTVRLNVVGATNVAVGANGSQAFDVPLWRYGGAADVAPSANPYTGWAVCEGIPGFADDVTVVITQLRPGALAVTGVTIEADL